MTKNYTYSAKQTGDTLSASEWNALGQDVDALVTAVNNGTIGGSNSGSGNSGSSVVAVAEVSGATDPTVNVSVASGVGTIGSPNVIQLTKKKKGVNTTVVSGNNINLEPRESVGETKGGNISFKPGDDIEFCSHHRLSGNQDEVSVKVIDGDDIPVKLQLNAAEMTLTTKDKTGNDANVFDINVNSGKNTKGYLKVRAQAIDLRCEDHGGIAIQPKGEDSQHNMNKIKFEHGGGDGLEFGTFNTEKTSIFTDEYRFNREGVWKMATRTKEVSDKYDDNDETTHYKYVKAADDFYDNIDVNDEQCTTKDIIKTAFAMNGAKDRHTKITNKGAIEIATNVTYTISETSEPEDVSGVILISTISTKLATLFQNTSIVDISSMVFNEGDFESAPSTSATYTDGSGVYFTFTEVAAPSIKIDSGSELKLGGILDFGSSFNFGETDNGIEVQYKLTKKNATKDCGVLKVVGVNNHTTNSLTVEGVTIAPGETGTIASCSLLDIIKLTNYMKTNNQGPWASNL